MQFYYAPDFLRVNAEVIMRDDVAQTLDVFPVDFAVVWGERRSFSSDKNSLLEYCIAGIRPQIFLSGEIDPPIETRCNELTDFIF